MPFRKKGSKNWHYDFRYRGRRFRGSCETENYQEAKLIEAEHRAEAKRTEASKMDYTLSQAFGTYYMDVCEPQPSAHTSFSQSKQLLEHFDGNTPIRNLTNQDLMKYVVKHRATQSNAYVNRKLEFMSRALRHMQKLYNAQIPDLDFSKTRTREPKENVRELSRDEEQRLFRHLRNDLHPMVWFALNTGARQNAIFALKWSDIGDTHISFGGSGQGKPPYKFRIAGPMRAFLSTLDKPEAQAHKAHVLTWVDRHGEPRPFNANNHWMWDRALKAAEIENFRFHDFRHTFATRMLRHTGNLQLVSKLLGHRDIQTTARYAHVLDSDFEGALETFYNPSPAQTPADARKTLKKQR